MTDTPFIADEPTLEHVTDAPPILPDPVYERALNDGFASPRPDQPLSEADMLRAQLVEAHASNVVLMEERDTSVPGEQKARYWQRRCEFAEAALAPFADLWQRSFTLNGGITFDAPLEEDLRAAHIALAEARKSQGLKDFPEIEQRLRNRRQARVLDWITRTWDSGVAVSLPERAVRMLEEAIELFQACMETAGYPAFTKRFPDSVTAHSLVLRLADRVFSRPVGNVGQELGGVLVTLLALAEATGRSCYEEETREFARVLAIPRAEFQRRHKVKLDAGL